MAEWTLQYSSEIQNGAPYKVKAQHLIDNFEGLKDDIDDRLSVVDAGGQTIAGAVTFSSQPTLSAGVKTDTISEKTSAVGVTVDGLTIKDGYLTPTLASDPVGSTNGSVWYNSTSGNHKANKAGTTRYVITDDECLTPGNSVGFIQPPHLITASTVLYSANTLFYVPVYLRPLTAITKIAVEVTSFAAGNGRLGIYTNGTNGKPSALLLDAGTISTGTSNGVKEVTISQTLGGWYWLAYVGDAAPTLRAFGTCTALLGRTSATALSESSLAAYSESFSYAALPSTPGTLTAVIASSNPVLLGVR